ncbi:uncharacterized protein BKA78DRAFT_351194 [Phyllosticta capitalensis]|uniref:NADH dehydrogenase [ubiquinone] 1 alpha subcomplex subunit 1 n=1 Tax=Phyllosticta capitalensis TaxID=121624 RepID=A0ABR1YSJ7_9PEZI
MGVPFEALLPYGIIVGMFGITSFGLSQVRRIQNGVMRRDKRLTGYHRGQADKPHAPKGFELNNPWHLEPGYTGC